MTPFLTTALGVLAALTVLLVACGLLLGQAFRAVTRRLERDLGQNPTTSLAEWIFGWRIRSLPAMSLTLQRAESGLPAHYPLESRPARSFFDGEVGFDPATLGPWPVAGQAPVATRTVLGPRARRPLALRTPVLVAPMGYGVALTADAKAALAEAATLTGTAVVTGEGPFFPEERALGCRYVLQWSRAQWAHQGAVVALADLVEIQVGQGAETAAAVVKPATTLPPAVRRLVASDAATIRASHAAFVADAMHAIRHANPDVPIGIKIPATHHLEADLAYVTQLGLDVITIDGSGAGSAGAPAVLSGHMGLDAVLAAHRAHRWLRERGLRSDVSLVVGGGVRGAADVAVLLALGADAVVVGTSLLLAMSHEQVFKGMPAAPPDSLVLAAARVGRVAPPFDRDRAAEHAANWLRATTQELTLIARAVGVANVHDLSPAHLVARSPRAHAALGLRYDADRDPRDKLVWGVGQLAAEYRRTEEVLGRIMGGLTRPTPGDGAAPRGGGHGG
jgi:NAD(P)H-dependent flavin oxidoreductase YrpB (nitropropane dioxygenase family)